MSGIGAIRFRLSELTAEVKRFVERYELDADKNLVLDTNDQIATVLDKLELGSAGDQFGRSVAAAGDVEDPARAQG